MAPLGIPSIDKPWTKYYSEAEKNVRISDGSMFDYLYERNAQYPNDIAIEYYGKKITYRELFNQIDQCCRNLADIGINKGDIVTVQALPLPQVIVTMYALNRIGACGNMLYPDAKAEEVVDSMRKTNSHLLVVMDKIFSLYEDNLPDTFTNTIILMGITEQIYKQGSVGIPFFAMNVKVLNENNEELKYGQVGELLFEGPNVMMGYFNNDLANEEAFVSDSDGRRWLRSGDLGYVDEDGFVFLKGRKKRIYITKGTDGTAYKLFPQRIEELVETDADVSKCGVIVCEDKDRMNVAKAFVSLKTVQGKNIENDVYERIIALLQRALPEHMRPIEVRVISEMPITANGKIDYRELEKIEN